VEEVRQQGEEQGEMEEGDNQAMLEQVWDYLGAIGEPEQCRETPRRLTSEKGRGGSHGRVRHTLSVPVRLRVAVTSLSHQRPRHTNTCPQSFTPQFDA
jgi:hypothetical protein